MRIQSLDAVVSEVVLIDGIVSHCHHWCRAERHGDEFLCDKHLWVADITGRDGVFHSDN